MTSYRVLPASTLHWAMYMFILQCILPGTISAPPPGPCSILALSMAADTASRARSPLVALTAAS